MFWISNIMDLKKKDIQYIQMCISMSEIFSTCSKRKYAAILVDEYGHIVGVGYNGGPKNMVHCSDGGCPRVTDNSPNGSMYDNCIAIHAEANAFLHSDYSARPKKIYINGPPCFSCAKLIANSTVEKIYYIKDNNYLDWEKVKSFLVQNSKQVIEVTNASIKA